MSVSKMKLEKSLKSTSTAYIFWLLLGAHYAYLGQWGKQLAFWFTFGGLGVWALIDMFRMSSKVEEYNDPIYMKIELEDHKEQIKAMSMNAQGSAN